MAIQDNGQQSYKRLGLKNIQEAKHALSRLNFKLQNILQRAEETLEKEPEL